MTFLQNLEDKAKQLHESATVEYGKAGQGLKYNKAKVAAWEKFEYYYNLIKSGEFNDVIDLFSDDMDYYRVEYIANCIRRYLAEDPSWREDLMANKVGTVYEIDKILSRGNRRRIINLFNDRIKAIGNRISVERAEILEAMERMSYTPAMFSDTPLSMKKIEKYGAWYIAEKINRSWFLDDQHYLERQFEPLRTNLEVEGDEY